MGRGIEVETLVSAQARAIRPNLIREILSKFSGPELISLAGGFPAPETFPSPETMQAIFAKALTEYAPRLFQYDASEGFVPLRESAAQFMAQKGVVIGPEHEVRITTGSQQMLFTLASGLIDPGDAVIVSRPTYLGALNAFDRFRPNYHEVDSDSEGMSSSGLQAAIAEAEAAGEQIKFIYTVPTFDNPTGNTYSAKRRQEIADIIQEKGLLLIEDDPYSELRYQGDPVPPLQQFAPEHVVYVTSTSKIFAPGFRIGMAVLPKAVADLHVQMKQGIDLNTSTVDQAMVAIYLRDGYLQQQLPQILEVYATRYAAMLAALDTHFDRNYFSWTCPDGGMFVWLTAPESVDTHALLPQAIAQKVAYVPGNGFYADPSQGENTMRLNFSNQPEAKIHQGIEILSRVLSPHF